MKYTYEQPDYLDVNGARHLVQELKKYIQDIMNGKIDISQYATKDELSSAVSSIDLSGYALKTEIPTVPSLDGYATTEYVDNAIANAPSGGGGNVDLSNYYTKDGVNNVIANTLSGYITSTAVDTKISSAINALYTKDEIDSKVKAVRDLYNNIDLTKYYTKTETNSFLDNKIEGVTVNGADATISSKKAIINLPQPDLSPYAKITDLVKYITQEYADAHYSREVNMTQVEFSALTTKDPNTIYNVWSDWTVIPE